MTKPIATADIETDPFKKGRVHLRPFLAGWYDGKTIRKFWGSDCIKQCYESFKKYDGYIYFHNGGKFDLHHFLDHIPAADILPDSNPPIHGRISSIQIRGGPTIFDSYLILPVPLASFGKEDIDYRLLEEDVRELPENKKKIHHYFDGDLLSLHDAVTDFIEDYGHGLTLAGRSFAEGKRLLDIKQYPTTNQFYDAKFRRFYYGGRTQFFRLGEIPFPVKVYDINSAYPAAMLARHGWGAKWECVSSEPRRRLDQSMLRVIGRSEGCFPVRTPDGLSFAHHRGEFFVTGWEYVAGIELGLFKVEKFICAHVPVETRDFSAYVHHFYTLKQKSTPGSNDYIFAKLMLNSFYGRFALNPREHRETLWLPFGEVPSDFLESDNEKVSDDEWQIEKSWDDSDLVLWSRKKPEAKWKFFDVALGASITGHARAQLMRAVALVDTPLYTDTDSIICRNGTGLKIGKEIGEWKLEAEGKLWIAGKKLYALQKKPGSFDDPNDEWKTAAKGVKLHPEDIKRLCRGETVEVESEAPTYSIHGPTRLISRRIRRADLIQRKLPAKHATKTQKNCHQRTAQKMAV